jgi:hypothetical protein
VFERRENLREINDLKYSLYERVVTFEGEEFHSRLCKVMFWLIGLVPLKGSLVPNRLNNIANSIAQHIANVSFEKTIPTRMILNLKIDTKDRVWLLWCSSLRSEKKIAKVPRPITPPKG